MKIKFGTDGWRAIIDEDFNQENVALATQAIAVYFNKTNKTKIVIGYDLRKKADKFARLAAEVMAGNGIQAFLVDAPCATPVTGWSIIDKKADGGIMFTASHNPAEFLGLKYMTDEAMTSPTEVTDEFEKNLAVLKPEDIQRKDFDKAILEGQIIVFDPTPSYFKKLKELVDLEKIKNSNLKVLLNPMHSIGAKYLPKLLSGGKLQVEMINEEPDPNFGGFPPEPIVEKNVSAAIQKVKVGNFDVCLSMDGDADRIGLIDERGRMLTSLEAFLLLVYYFVVVKGKRGPIVKTSSNTIMTDHLAAKFGLEVSEVKVGFKYVGEKMKELKAILGGEESGGSAIAGYMYVRDAQVMNLYILDLMISLEKPLSEILSLAEEEAGGGYQFRREDVHLPYESYEKIKTEKTKELTNNPPQEILSKKVVKTRSDDGIKFYFEDDSWLLVRFSGTEPVLRLYAEAKTMDEVDKLIDFAKDFFSPQ